MNDFFFEKYLEVLNKFVLSNQPVVSFTWTSVGEEQEITFSRGKMAINEIIFEEHSYKDGFYTKNVTGFYAHGNIILAMSEASFDPGSTEWQSILAKYNNICFLKEYALRFYEFCFQCVFSSPTNLYNIPQTAKDAMLATNEVFIPPTMARKQAIQDQFCSNPEDTEVAYQAFLKMPFAPSSCWLSPQITISFFKVFMDKDPSFFVRKTKKRILDLLANPEKPLDSNTNDPVSSILKVLLYLDRLYRTLHEVIGTHAEETLRLRDRFFSAIKETKNIGSAKITYTDGAVVKTASVQLAGDRFILGEFDQFWLGPAIDFFKSTDGREIEPFLIHMRVPLSYYIFPWNKIKSIQIGKKIVYFS